MAKKEAKRGESGDGERIEVPPAARRRRRKPPTGVERGFYAQALTEAERIRLPQAREIEGLDEEIALLRVRLSSLVREHPENTELLLKGVGMLVRAVATRYRLSKKAEDDLYQSVLGVLRGIGDVLYPEGFPT